MLVVLVVLGALAWFGRSGRGGAKDAPIASRVSTKKTTVLVGANLPLSGPMSYYGQEVQRGLTLAFDGEAEIRPVYEDNHSVARDAVTVFQMFASRGTPIVISSNSPLSAPQRALAQESRIVLLALVTGAEDFADGNPWVFRDAITQTAEAPPLADYAWDALGARKMVSLVVNDDYGLGGSRAFKRQFETRGGTVVAEETFETANTDLRAQLTKLKTARPDAIYIAGRQQNLIAAIVQARELAVAPQILTGDSFDSPSVIEGVGAAGQGVVFSSYDIDLSATEEARQFEERFLKRFGSEPGVYAVDAYAAGRYLLDIFRRVGPDAGRIREEMSKLKTTSIKGPLEVTKDHDILPPIGIFKLGNGEKVRLMGTEKLRAAA